jgi:gliding motility-associated-like protein
MKPALYVIVCLMGICFPVLSMAQGQNNQWCFGQRYGFNFNTNPPSFFETNMRVFEGSASVCDNAGNLLFYSSGAYNWDRNGNLMPNGQGLNGNGPLAPSLWPENIGSSSKGVAIVPNPANSNQYYIIVTDAIEDLVYNAYYSVIDMTLNGGLGDVIPTQKNILLTTDISEGVVATTASDCFGYWAVLHSRFGFEYRAFRIDNNGISTTPVISSGLVGNPTAWVYGYLQFNTGGTMLARSGTEVEMADFNKTTGVLSSFFTVQAAQSSGGLIEFSPDDTKLYVSNFEGLRQFNLGLLPNVAAVQNTQLLIDTAHVTTMRLGPDNKIYLAGFNSNYFSVINSPNTLGTGCQFASNAYLLPVYITPQFFFVYELGNKVPVNMPADTFIQTVLDTTVCFEQSLTLHAPDNYQSYFWFSNATTPEVTVSQDGAYWLHGHNSCNLYIDSFKVHFINFDVNLGADTSICEGTQITLDATTPDATYRWQDNSILPTYTASNEGMYKVNVTVGKCSKSDSILVDVMEPFADIIEGDTTICINQPFVLHGTAYPESNYLWGTGAVSENISISSEGTYILTASNVCGDFVDSVNIKTMDCSCNVFMPNAFSPNGDDINEIVKAELHCSDITAFTFRIYNRFGQCVFESSDVNKGWDGYYNNGQADVGTYFYYIQYKVSSGTVVKKKGDVVLIR